MIALAALAQPTRLAIFRRLVEYAPDGLTPGAIATALDLAPATLSFHLKELANAGLIADQREGRLIRYRADLAAMNALIGYLTDNCCRAGRLVDSAAARRLARRPHAYPAPRAQETTMKRFHVHLAVPDLAASIRFYSDLFGFAPTVEKPDYAKWMLDEPRVNFAISQRGARTGAQPSRPAGRLGRRTRGDPRALRRRRAGRGRRRDRRAMLLRACRTSTGCAIRRASRGKRSIRSSTIPMYDGERLRRRHVGCCARRRRGSREGDGGLLRAARRHPPRDAPGRPTRVLRLIA